MFVGFGFASFDWYEVMTCLQVPISFVFFVRFGSTGEMLVRTYEELKVRKVLLVRWL